jgi:hypothetical protein
VPAADPQALQVLGLLVGAMLSAECALRLPLRFAIRQLNGLGRMVVWSLHNPRISVRWKERAVLVYALQLQGWGFRVPAWLALTLSPLALSVWLVTASLERMLALLFAPLVWLGFLAWACLYRYARVRQLG